MQQCQKFAGDQATEHTEQSRWQVVAVAGPRHVDMYARTVDLARRATCIGPV